MAKRKIIWSPRAKLDQYEILGYYSKRNGNKTYSRKLFKRFKNAISLLAKHPEIGVRTDVKNVRSLVEGDYTKLTMSLVLFWILKVFFKENPAVFPYRKDISPEGIPSEHACGVPTFPKGKDFRNFYGALG